MTFDIAVVPPRLVAPRGPVSAALRTMREADPDAAADAAIEAIRAGLDRYFSDLDHQHVRALRRALADRIEADLDALDMLGGDPDLEDGADREQDAGDMPEGVPYGLHDATEDDEPDHESEPSLGSLGGTAAVEYHPQKNWSQGTTDDREEEDEHGTDIDAGEAGDDNGIADWSGASEQAGRYIAMGGDMNRLPQGYRA